MFCNRKYLIQKNILFTQNLFNKILKLQNVVNYMRLFQVTTNYIYSISGFNRYSIQGTNHSLDQTSHDLRSTNGMSTSQLVSPLTLLQLDKIPADIIYPTTINNFML